MSPPDDDRQARERRALYEAAHKLPREPVRPRAPRAPSTPEGAPPPQRPGAAGGREGSDEVALRPWERLQSADASEGASVPGGETPKEEPDVVVHAGRVVLALGALGVVFGDLGTSPLYTLHVSLGFRAAARVDPASVYGIISLIFWGSTVIISTKYAGVIMRAHNRGDGGILALASVCRRRKVPRALALVTLGVVGASLFLGDGVITPAISVLSAVEGLEVPAPGLAHLVVPISIVILLGLFAFQRFGTGTVGQLFGPVMLVWFAVLALLGGHEVVRHPAVLQALSPTWGIRFFLDHGVQAFLALGGIVLALTGAEALYADRGHFGPAPIRIAWFGVVFPAVLLDYLGQAALVLAHHADKSQPFFLLAPSWGRVPLVLLATLATIIASQAVISGSYSVAKQAMQLGYLPRLRVVHTSKMEGQIYVPVVNLVLAIGVVALVVGFQKSTSLSNAYGLAVTGTFVLDTTLFLAVARSLWRPSLWKLIPMGALFLTFEVAFFAANLEKILQGAWFPLVTGIVISVVMLTWNRGRAVVTANRGAKEGSLREFLDHLNDLDPPVQRVPGTGIFLNPGRDTTPLALRAAIEHTHSLHEKVLVVSVEEVSLPSVDDAHRFVIQRLGPEEFSLRYVGIRVGYQEKPDVPTALRLARRELLLERDLDLERASYFISRITIVPDEHSPLRRWQQKLFVAVARNAASPIEHFNLPDDRTVSVGSQIGA